ILLIPVSEKARKVKPSEAIAAGNAASVGIGYSVMTPAGVILPMLFPLLSVNHMLRSSPPSVIPAGWLLVVGIGNSVRTPAGVRRAIWFPVDSVIHMLPSGPAAIAEGPPGTA